MVQGEKHERELQAIKILESNHKNVKSVMTY